MNETPTMPTAIGGTLGALLALYHFLPTFGVHVPTLPDSVSAGAVGMIAFIVGLFTKPPQATPQAKP